MEVLTAAESEGQQRAIAGALRARGLGTGDRVALLTSSTGPMLSAILGALRVGIVPVLLNAGLLPHERDALLDDAAPALIVDDALLTELLDHRGPPAELHAHPLARPMHYTSGTTGTPKGVWSGILDPHEAEALYREEADLWGFAATDRHLVCSPFHHSVSIRFGGGTLLAGGTVVVLGRFTAAAAAEALRSMGVNTAFMVPAHLQRLFAEIDERDLAARLDGFRLLVHAGAPCPPPLKERAIATFGASRVWEFYGSTEGQFTACPSAEWLAHPGTVGRARAGRTLRVDDDGTIWCEAPDHARFSYWRDPEKTAGAWRDEPGGGRSFTVGDLGRLGGDGELYLDGRRHDLLISGGVNVYPAEIEAALAHTPGVAEVAVFGRDDERWGDRVCAAVVPEPGTGADADGLIEAVRRTAIDRLAPYKRPKEVHVVGGLPHTATGKLQRDRVAASIGLGGVSEDRDLGAPPR